MAIETRERNTWAVSMLNLQSSDSVLEIGFGPGLAIQQVAKVAHFVAGIDHSATMVQQASKRNGRAIRAGTVELRQCPVQHLPYSSSIFDKVFAGLQEFPGYDPHVAAFSADLRCDTHIRGGNPGNSQRA